MIEVGNLHFKEATIAKIAQFGPKYRDLVVSILAVQEMRNESKK